MRRPVVIAGALLLAASAVVLASAATEWPSATAAARIETTAPVDAVWETLVAFDEYDEWNPFVTSASGTAGEGAAVELVLEPPGAGTHSVTAEIVILRPGRKLRWQSRLVAPGIRDRELEVLVGPSGTPGALLVTASLRHEGVLVPLGSLDGVEEGLGLMLAALAERAEAVAQS